MIIYICNTVLDKYNQILIFFYRDMTLWGATGWTSAPWRRRRCWGRRKKACKTSTTQVVFQLWSGMIFASNHYSATLPTEVNCCGEENQVLHHHTLPQPDHLLQKWHRGVDRCDQLLSFYKMKTKTAQLVLVFRLRSKNVYLLKKE